MDDQPSRPLMCSLVSREEDDQLIGTARDVPQFLFLELEKPWASSALQTDHFPEALFEAYQEGLRKETFSGKFLLVAPDSEYSRDDMVRMMHYRRPDGPFSRYEGTSYFVPEEELITAARVLLTSPSDRSDLDHLCENGMPGREIFVCTHTERDPCCGHFGSSIYHALRTHYANEDRRVWQVSHVGGHRYCPNLIDLPDGRYWGRMELGTLENFIHRNGTFEEISAQYRGWAAMSSVAQLVEKTAFEREGWSWIEIPKTCDVQQEGDSSWRVAISYRGANRSGVYRGVVEQGDPVRALQSECGSEGPPEYKQAKQYRLVELHHEQTGDEGP